MDGNGCVSEYLSLRCYSSAQALDRGEICLRSICQASWPSPTTTLDSKGTTKRRRHVWSFLGVCMAGWEWLCE